MSSLLEQAFVDAKALKEAALKNAEATIVEKYSTEVKETLEKILEQDAMDLGAPAGDAMGAAMGAPVGPAAEDVPLGAAEGEDLCACDDEDEESTIKVNFDELAETLKKLEEDMSVSTIEEDEEIELTEEDLAALTEDDDEDPQGSGEMADSSGSAGEGEAAAAQTAAAGEQDEDAMKGMEEEINFDSLVDAIMEKISLDEVEEEIEEAKGDKGPYADGAKAKAGVDDDGDGVPNGADKDKDDPDVKESLEADSLVAAVMEKLTVDMGADLTGWAGRRAEDKKFAIEKELAARRSTHTQDAHLEEEEADTSATNTKTELEDLKQAQEELVFENNQLKEKLQNYENVVGQLKESVTDVNLSNARLLYTNRVLRNTSLNERQKDKIAEAISKAGSVPEAKTIFETLQSTVESTPKRGPQSLSETINRRSSILRANSRGEAKPADPIADRMKKLAGIN